MPVDALYIIGLYALIWVVIRLVRALTALAFAVREYACLIQRDHDGQSRAFDSRAD